MNDFNRLVSEQMTTMDQLLYLQADLDRCQDLQKELGILQKEAKLREVQVEINRMKKELEEIQKIFEKQTQEVINSYQNLQTTHCG
ncbi:MAG: YgaB family protein [Bacillota bacterium]|nr:YgaB family protein [Bacillota bacterium]